MKLLSDDTHPEVERLQIDLIRKAPVFRRLQMAVSLTKTTRWLSWQAICKCNPDKTHEERIRQYILHLYGDELLAERIAGYLKKRKESDDSA
ncbi:MAG: hypothetical protein COZ32_04645 [Nitrospirae bacterium CG_4_10_14_3_um_filter_53_41]|nr:MAG: hypothetical protein COW52_12380 [Nitrospirae bacterium CG17_big_fil_post_rev_8_21_14_2_50_50_9]PIX86189.1 MAG: hypothetical protein COZ32_04645 [Nitrospirae bacterium CG_4_10_14_3_um_filter_53_41]